MGLTIETDRGTIKAEVGIEGNERYAQNVAADLVDVASTATGAEMMRELGGSGRTLTIGMPSEPDRAYTKGVGRLTGPPGVGRDVRISYNPEGNYSYQTTGGDLALTDREYAAMSPDTDRGLVFVNPAVVLGHELAHAVAVAQGTVMDGPVSWQHPPKLNERGYPVRLDEVFATARGNTLAREMGMPEVVDERVF